MKRLCFSAIASLLLAGALVGAQSAPAQDPADDTTLKGCLVQGSGPDVFILENAKRASDGADAKGENYIVQITAKPDQIQPILNSHVEITGTAVPKAAVAASSDDKKAKEADFPKLTAKRISRLAATCPASGD